MTFSALYHLPNCDERRSLQLSQDKTNQPAPALLVSPHPRQGQLASLGFFSFSIFLFWSFGLFLTWRWSGTSLIITVINAIAMPRIPVLRLRDTIVPLIPFPFFRGKEVSEVAGQQAASLSGCAVSGAFSSWGWFTASLFASPAFLYLFPIEHPLHLRTQDPMQR